MSWEHEIHFHLQCQLDLDFLTLLKFYPDFYSATNLLNFEVNLKRGNKPLISHEIILLFLIFKNCTYCSWTSSSVHSSPTLLEQIQTVSQGSYELLSKLGSEEFYVVKLDIIEYF